jgi:hypothetical protein
MHDYNEGVETKEIKVTTSYQAKEIAVFIRGELKQAFPGQKFSVKSERHSVRVQWVDGPSVDSVSAITKKFGGMHFDGMEDLTKYGVSQYKGEQVRFCCYTPDTDRHYTLPVFKAAVDQVAASEFVWSDVDVTALEYKESIYSGTYLNAAPTNNTNCCYRNLDVEARDLLDSQSFYTVQVKITKAAQAPTQEPTPTESAKTIAVTENTERDGVEIRFPVKPSSEVIESLKLEGFRWSRFSECWYAKRSPEALAFAHGLTIAKPEHIAEVLAIAPSTETLPSVVVSEFERVTIPAVEGTTQEIKQLALYPSTATGLSYVVVTDYPTLPVFALRSPQQELKDKLALLNVDELSADRISELLRVLN